MKRIGLAVAIAFALTACVEDSDMGWHGRPTGACDTSLVDGSCVEHLGSDDGQARSYCVNAVNGAWVATCPTANRIASCRWPSSIQYWYANYAWPLGDVQYQCELYGESWTTY